jgi:hypothetical protein
MKWWIRPGQEVICVNQDGLDDYCSRMPNIGEHFTILFAEPHPRYAERIGLNLLELAKCNCGKTLMFNSECFQPVRKTDTEVEKLLTLGLDDDKGGTKERVKETEDA